MSPSVSSTLRARRTYGFTEPLPTSNLLVASGSTGQEEPAHGVAVPSTHILYEAEKFDPGHDATRASR